MITIKDVAKDAGVSISTVSKALNNSKNISVHSKEKVIKSVNKLNYVPNLNAKLLKLKKTNNIGFFIPTIYGEFYHVLLESAFQSCREKMYSLEIFVSNLYSSYELCLQILSSNIDGAIILNDNFKSEQLDSIERNGLPTVFLDREVHRETISSIVMSNAKGSKEATEYLIKTGHKNIAFIQGYNNYDNEKRFSSFIKTLKDNNLEVEPNFMLQGYFEEFATYNAVRSFFMNNVKKPDSFFCANDEMARGCVKALNDLGFIVPDDISVIGFDNTAISEYFTPPLTTVSSPFAELGKRSVEELISLINKGTTGSITYLDTKLMIRNSVKSKFM
jgi:LacI family transcriptional regulator